MRLIEGLDQSECATQLGDPAFTQSLAAIAMHTRDTNCEGGFLLTRNADGIQVGRPIMPKEAHENGGYAPEEGLFSPAGDSQPVLSIHTHPVRRFGIDNRVIALDEILSFGDLYHMRHHQRACGIFILGMMRKDMTHPDDDKVVLDLYRSTVPLPEDDYRLLGEYEWAAGRDFKHELQQSLGVQSARFGFDIVGSSVHPNALWGDHQTEIAKLYTDSPPN